MQRTQRIIQPDRFFHISKLCLFLCNHIDQTVLQFFISIFVHNSIILSGWPLRPPVVDGVRHHLIFMKYFHSYVNYIISRIFSQAERTSCTFKTVQDVLPCTFILYFILSGYSSPLSTLLALASISLSCTSPGACS